MAYLFFTLVLRRVEQKVRFRTSFLNGGVDAVGSFLLCAA